MGSELNQSQVLRPKPLAMVVFLENVGHLHGIDLPPWVTMLIDWGAEEYAKLVLRWHGVFRRYDRVIVLEDDHATGPELAAALCSVSRTHRVDLLLLVHGGEETLVGYKGKHRVGNETFLPLLQAYQQDHATVDLRMVWQMNCYGASLTGFWRALGAQVVNGSVGINWLPEPTLSLFLRHWMRGESFSQAVVTSTTQAMRWWRRVYRPDCSGNTHPRLASSSQIVVGAADITIDS